MSELSLFHEGKRAARHCARRAFEGCIVKLITLQRLQCFCSHERRDLDFAARERVALVTKSAFFLPFSLSLYFIYKLHAVLVTGHPYQPLSRGPQPSDHSRPPGASAPDDCTRTTSAESQREATLIARGDGTAAERLNVPWLQRERQRLFRTTMNTT